MPPVRHILASLAFFLILLCLRTDASSTWGYQENGQLSCIAGNNNEGALYATGTQQIYPYNYFVAKISSSGHSLWQYMHHDENPGNEVFAANPCCLDFDISNSVLLAGSKIVYNSYQYGSNNVFVSKLSWNGIFHWETLIQDEGEVRSIAVDSNGDSYILLTGGYIYYQKSESIEREEIASQHVLSDLKDFVEVGDLKPIKRVLNDKIIKVSPNGTHIYTVVCTILSDYVPSQSVFSQLIINADDELELSGVFTVYSPAHMVQSARIVQIVDKANATVISEDVYKDNDPDRYNFYAMKYIVKMGDDSYRGENVWGHYYGHKQDAGYVIRKNKIQDGLKMVPASTTISVAEPCPGLSWSIYSEKDSKNLPNRDCEYYYVGMSALGETVVLCLLVGTTGFLVWYFKFKPVYVFGSLLATLNFSVDVLYIVTVVFRNQAFFALAIVFLFLPMIHFCYEVVRGRDDIKKHLRMCFPLVEVPYSLIIISSRNTIPYPRETRVAPDALTSYSDSYLTFLLSWLAAGTCQFLYCIVYFMAFVTIQFPWLIVHGPYYCLILTIGYLLYMTNLLPHQNINRRWCNLLLKEDVIYVTSSHGSDPESQKSSAGSNDRMQMEKEELELRWTIVVASFVILILEMAPQLSIQIANNRAMQQNSIVNVVSYVTKAIFLLNLIDRIAVYYGSTFFGLISQGWNRSHSYFVSLQGSETDSGDTEDIPTLKQRIRALEEEIEELKIERARFRGDDASYGAQHGSNSEAFGAASVAEGEAIAHLGPSQTETRIQLINSGDDDGDIEMNF